MFRQGRNQLMVTSLCCVKDICVNLLISIFFMMLSSLILVIGLVLVMFVVSMLGSSQLLIGYYC